MSENEEELKFPSEESEEEEKVDIEDVPSEEAPSEEAAEDKTAELEKRYMALFAEYENFRKRSAKEKEDLYASAVATVTKDFLSVLDNIERALEAGKNADENSVLSKLGVKEIECERGTKFDPNLHEAVMHVDDGELGEQEVAAVFQKGYIYKDRVVRHAVVQVAN